MIQRVGKKRTENTISIFRAIVREEKNVTKIPRKQKKNIGLKI